MVVLETSGYTPIQVMWDLCFGGHVGNLKTVNFYELVQGHTGNVFKKHFLVPNHITPDELKFQFIEHLMTLQILG